VLQGKEQETKDAIFAVSGGKSKEIRGLKLEEKEAKAVIRQWKLCEDKGTRLLRDVSPASIFCPTRFSLTSRSCGTASAGAGSTEG
jgi:hypothetical protein